MKLITEVKNPASAKVSSTTVGAVLFGLVDENIFDKPARGRSLFGVIEKKTGITFDSRYRGPRRALFGWGIPPEDIRKVRPVLRLNTHIEIGVIETKGNSGIVTHTSYPFLPGRSTETDVLEIHDFISDNSRLDEGQRRVEFFVKNSTVNRLNHIFHDTFRKVVDEEEAGKEILLTDNEKRAVHEFYRGIPKPRITVISRGHYVLMNNGEEETEMPFIKVVDMCRRNTSLGNDPIIFFPPPVYVDDPRIASHAALAQSKYEEIIRGLIKMQSGLNKRGGSLVETPQAVARELRALIDVDPDHGKLGKLLRMGIRRELAGPVFDSITETLEETVGTSWLAKILQEQATERLLGMTFSSWW